MSKAFSLVRLLLLASLLPFAGRGTGNAAPAPQPDAAIDYFVVVTGGELLGGAFPDSHTHFLTRTLRPLGLHCVGSLLVDDRRADMLDALRFATEKARLVIVTGGLGPTDNDITRETLAEFTGLPLRENEAALRNLEQRLGKSRDGLPANLRCQVLVPEAGEFLANANGTAAGLVFAWGSQTVVALPGPPRELEPMVRDALVPCLARRFGVHTPGCSLTARFAGIGQSGIDQILEQHIALPKDIILQSQFEGRRVDFTFALPHDRPEDRACLDELKAKLLQHLGEFIYAFGNETLEQVVLAGFREQGGTLSLAEVGSGGALAASLFREPEAEKVLQGAFCAASESALARLLHIPETDWAALPTGQPRLERLATAAAQDTGSEWVLVLGAAEQNTLTALLQRPGRPPEILALSLRGSPDTARATLVTQLLTELRQRLR